MTTAEILAGDLTANLEERVVSGLLLPYGEIGHTNLGQFSVEAGVITIPRDISTLVANEGHSQTDPRARFLTATDTPSGIVASFKIGTNEEDDLLLARIDEGRKNGKPMALSVEVKGVSIKDGKATSGRLTGAAFVERGAFASAALMAAAVDTVEAPVEPEAQTADILTPDETGDLAVTSAQTPSTVTVTAEDTTTVFTPEPVINPEGESVMATATVPGTLTAPVVTEATPFQKLDKLDLFAMIVNAKQSGETGVLMAALSDVKTGGAGSVGINSIAPDFVGQVWSGNTFTRRVIPLLRQGTLTKAKSSGYRFVVKPQVGPWAGDKTDIPSNAPTTEAVTWTAERMAGGWDIAREFYDFNDVEAIDELLKLAATDYARKSDAKTLVNLLASATSSTLIAAQGNGYGGGAKVAGVSNVTQAIVRGALRVVGNDATPTYALVNPIDYESLIYTKELDTLAFIGQSMGLNEGTTAGMQVVPHVGITAGTVLVGDKQAAASYELGGVPIRVSAIDIARGGVDEALFGYFQTRVEFPLGLQLVTAINA